MSKYVIPGQFVLEQPTMLPMSKHVLACQQALSGAESEMFSPKPTRNLRTGDEAESRIPIHAPTLLAFFSARVTFEPAAATEDAVWVRPGGRKAGRRSKAKKQARQAERAGSTG